MKLSRYTFLFGMEGKGFYAYNTLSNALLEIDEPTYFALKNDLAAEQFDKDLWEALTENNIVTESDEDDYLTYKSIMMRQRNQRQSMHLTLAPTMDCCFRCHYCFEKYKEPNYMSEAMMDSIIKYVTSYTELQDIHITWFGGEPLMALPQIEAFYDKLSAVWKKSVPSNIITTGYHLNEEAVRVLKKVGVSQVQITLDGLKETHNKVKHLDSGEDVFERVISNIELLNDLAPEINIVIRVNLTLENAHEYEGLCKFYFERCKERKNMGITPAFVLDRGTSNCDACAKETQLFSHAKRSEFVLDLAHKGYDSAFIRYPERFFNECAIRNEMAISFDPEGYAYKCWEVIGNKEYAIGKLNDEGMIVDVNTVVLNRQLFGADTIDDPICSKCKYLPICNGGCPIQRLENKFENGRNETCTPHKGFMEEFLKVHLARKKMAEHAVK